MIGPQTQTPYSRSNAESIDRDAELANQLVAWLDDLGEEPNVRSLVIAFSGGVDSSVVAAAATRSQLPAVAVTAVSPAVASWQVELATRVANEIGIEHIIVHTNESTRKDYQRNGSDRCFFCKQTLYEFLQPIALERQGIVLSGTNADDLGDHRPGIAAGREAGVVTPLATAEISKSDVRSIADQFGLSNADLPASPCLASRIAYGVEVTPERLLRIDRAEAWLRQLGFHEFRVRMHENEIARIEVPIRELTQLVVDSTRESLVQHFLDLGFTRITLDLEGFRSGNLNDGLPSDVVKIGQPQFTKSSRLQEMKR